MRTKRPLKFKLDAYRLYVQDNMKPVDAFAEASRLNNNVPLSGCMTNRGYASSYMSDDVKNYLRKRNKDLDIVSYFNNWGLDINF